MNLSGLGKKASQYPILFVCGVLAPLALILLLMRAPKVSGYERQLSELEREWQSIQMNMERSAGLENDISRLENGLEAVRERLMDVEEVAINYEFFYDLEERAGVTFSRFVQEAASNGAELPLDNDGMRHFSVLPYDLQIQGTVEELLGFLDLLDRQRYIIRMDSLRLSLPPADSTTEGRALSGRLRCHVLAEKHE